MRKLAGPEDVDPRDRLHVALAPANPLTEEPAVAGQALLVHCVAHLLLPQPAGLEQGQSEVLILGQAVAPGAVGISRGDVPLPYRRERGEPVDLAVPAHPCGAPRGPAHLEHGAEHAELHVLHVGEWLGTVVDPHRQLHPADRLVEESTRHVVAQIRIQSAIGVHDHDQRALLAESVPQLGGQLGADVAPSLVEGRRLALARLGRDSGEHLEIVARMRGQDLAGRVRGPVVDHDDASVRDPHLLQPGNGVSDRHLLVEGRDQEHPEELRLVCGSGCPALLTAAPNREAEDEGELDEAEEQGHGEQDLHRDGQAPERVEPLEAIHRGTPRRSGDPRRPRARPSRRPTPPRSVPGSAALASTPPR